MDSVFITTAYIPRVCFIILYVVLVGYLLSRPRKSTATKWLIVFSIFFCITDVGWDVIYLIPVSQMPRWGLLFMFTLGQGMFIPTALAYVQFAYTFQGNTNPREARVMLVLAGVLSVAILLLILTTPRYLFSPWLERVQVGMLLMFILMVFWAAVVLVRKTVAFSRAAQAAAHPEAGHVGAGRWWTYLRTPVGRSARACRFFIGVTLALLSVIIGGMLVWGLGLFLTLGTQLFWLGYMLFLYSLLVGYVNYASEPTSVQAKLVGAALTTLLLFVVILTRTLFPEAEMLRRSGIYSPAPQTLRFVPTEAGGFVVTPYPAQFKAPVGQRLAVDVGHAEGIGFSFPLYGTAWDSLYISENGLVSMGPLSESPLDWTMWPTLQETPVMAPLGIDLEVPPEGGVYYHTTPDSTVVTWYNLSLAGGEDSFTAQLVLYPSGVLAFHYGPPGEGMVAASMDKLGVRGLLPATRQAAQALPAMLTAPIQSAPGAALVEDYGVLLYRYQQQKGLPLLVLVIAVSLFILFVFPYVFRTSLLKPLDRLLEGVQRVEAGATDTAVAVAVQDEIGTLTGHFNQMAAAIHQGEQQLQAYAETLEQKVDARTAELSASLETLKKTQAQLVQAEKMASLGTLTSGIAHEIKNPLNFVNNFAQLSSELAVELAQEIEAHQGLLPAESVTVVQDLLKDLRANSEKIEAHGRRADSIVRAMMQHAHTGRHTRSPTPLNALVDEYVNLAYHGMRAGQPEFEVALVRTYEDTLGEVDLVPPDIGRVLINLLNNAFFAVQDHLQEAPGGYTPTVEVTTHRVDGYAEIRVADNGPGIDEALQAKIFEPFFTTKPAGSGTGLGLSLSYDIVTQGHGGRMWVERNAAGGATFVVALPVPPGPSA